LGKHHTEDLNLKSRKGSTLLRAPILRALLVRVAVGMYRATPFECFRIHSGHEGLKRQYNGKLVN
jgi:hypothetical protein